MRCSHRNRRNSKLVWYRRPGQPWVYPQTALPCCPERWYRIASRQLGCTDKNQSGTEGHGQKHDDNIS